MNGTIPRTLVTVYPIGQGSTYKPCKEFCPDGHKCVLRSNVPHTMHLCSNPNCYCHTQRRYIVERTQRERGLA